MACYTRSARSGTDGSGSSRVAFARDVQGAGTPWTTVRLSLKTTASHAILLRMSKLILIVFLFTASPLTAIAGDPYKWTWEDTALQTVYSGFLVADWSQTLHTARDHITQHNFRTGFTPYYESQDGAQRFIGKYPSKRNVNMYFTTMMIGHAAVSYLLPKPYRTIWQSFYIIYEYDTVQKNRDIGLGVNLHF